MAQIKFKSELYLFSLLATGSALATSPQLQSVLPTGGQRGTSLEVTFGGERLQDTQELLWYEAGLKATKLTLVTNKEVKAQVEIAPDCPLGEHHVRLRSETGLSELRTFFVGPFPAVAEVEPNNNFTNAQRVPLNSTVTGVIPGEDVDCFLVDAKKGQRISAEVEGMRLGRGAFDPRLALLETNGTVLAEAGETWLGRQDPFLSFLAPHDGSYIVQLREVTYGGNANCHYRLHIGTFARPDAVFPLGGPADSTLAFTFTSEASGAFTNQIKLPASPQERFGLFAELDGLSAPTANWVRVSKFPNVLAVAPNQDREHATVTDLPPPFALNGVLTHKSQEDWFRFSAVKGAALELNVYARRLHSPLDSVLEIQDHKGNVVSSNDDAGGADSSLKFTAAETTNYFVRIRDLLGQGGRDFTYRIEVTPVQPQLAIKIPEVARNDTQSRQFIAVPRGNRFATLISVRRANFSGDLTFALEGLPAGVTMQAEPMPKNIDAMPLVFEAAPDAPIGARLLDLTASGTNGAEKVTGNFLQEVELVAGPNNTSFYGTSVDKLCVAVTKEAPFKLRVAQPQVPLVQNGSMKLEVIAERAAGFEEPIEVQMVWNPPGVTSQPEVTIAKGATNVFCQLSANGGAETRSWKIAVLGHAKVDDGQVYVASALTPLEVAPPFLSGKIETLWLNPGKQGKLTVSLQQVKPFEGKATIRLCGLPEKVAAPEKEITKDDQEVVFEVTADAKCQNGSHKNLFCAVEVKQGGQVIPHNIAFGGILRVVPPKKETVSVATAGKGGN